MREPSVQNDPSLNFVHKSRDLKKEEEEGERRRKRKKRKRRGRRRSRRDTKNDRVIVIKKWKADS